MLYEVLLLLGVLSISFVVPYLIVGIAWHTVPAGGFLWLHIFVVLGAYFIYYWTHGGQTLAMQTWRVRLVDANSGGSVSRKQAALRYVLSWPSVCFFAAGLFWAFFDRDRQFMHDRLAGTRVEYLGKR